MDVEIPGISGDIIGSVIAGRDVKNVSLINAGDITGSYNNIVTGGQLVITQARSVIEELEREAQLAERCLAEAVVNKVRGYTRLIQRSSSTDRHNPYKALLDYKLEDSPFFYGREEAIAALLDQLHQARLTILHSESGAGKTSLLQAGLASRLLAAGHLPLYVRSYRQPPTAAIKKQFLPDIGTLPELARLADMTLEGFLSKVSQYLGKSTLYVFLDQFEDFFVEHQPSQQKTFVAELANCLNEPGLNVRWVLALRKEHFSDLNIFRPHIPAPFENDYFLRTFSQPEAKQVITEPAKKNGVRYEPGLVDTILSDLSQDDSRLAPPQVQLVCYTLFDELSQEADPHLITRKLYQRDRDLGGPGAKGILSSHLNRVLNRMKIKERELAREILEALATSQSRRMIKSKDTLIAELRQTKDEAHLSGVEAVLETLLDNRLLRIDEDDKNQPYFELAHAYLLDEIELNPETRARKAAQEILAQEVAAWRNNKQLRIPGDKLDIIEAQEARLVLDKDAKTLLQLSREAFAEAQRRAKRQRQVVKVGTGVVVVLVILAVVSTSIAIIANATAKKAETRIATAEAVIERLNLEAASISIANQSSSTRNPERALYYAIQAATMTRMRGQEVPAQTKRALFQSLTSPLRAVLEGHRGDVKIVSFSPDGRYVVTLSWDATARIWEVETGQELHVLDAGLTTSVSFSGDGRYMVTGSADNAARIWEVETGREIVTLLGHTATVSSVSFSPNGRFVATGSFDKTARIWEVETGRELHILEGHSGTVNSVDFSPDGHYVVTGSDDTTARIWEVETGREVHILEAHRDNVSNVSFSPDGRYVLTASDDTTARIWVAQSGQEVRTLEGHQSKISGAIFSPTGRHVVTGSDDTTARIWEVEGGRALHTLTGHRGIITSVSFSPDGRYVATGSGDATSRVWEVETGQELVVLEGHRGWFGRAVVNSVSFSPDGRYVVTGSDDNTARIWEFGMRRELHILEGHSRFVRSVGFSPDGRYMVTASGDATARIWDVKTGEDLHTLEGHRDTVSSVSFSPVGRYVATGSFDKTARIWEVETGRDLHILTGHSDMVSDVSFSPDGRYVATGSFDHTARLWAVDTGREVRTLEGHLARVSSVNFSPDSRYLVTGSDDTSASIWDIGMGRELHTLGTHQKQVLSANFSPDGRYIVTASLDATARIWDVETGRQLHVLKGHRGIITSASFSPDNRYVVTGSTDTTARVWDVESGLMMHALVGHNDEVSCVSFSPDGRYVITASNDTVTGGGDNSVRIWDLETGLELYTFRGHNSGIISIDVSPNGQYVASGSLDTTARIWRIPTVEEMVSEAKSRIRPSLQVGLEEELTDNP